MNIKILTLLFVTFALHTYADTIAWRGVSDLGGNGLSIVTGSQTRGADGSFSTSSSSSSSSFNDGYGVSSSPPRTTWTIASSRPIDTLVTTTPTSRSTTPVTTTQIPSLTGSWYITTVGNQSVNIPSSFSSSSINFDYCNPQRFSYSTSGSSFISISGGNTGTQSCSYSGPTQSQIRSALNGAQSYSFSGNELFLRNSLGNNLAVLNKNPRSNYASSAPIAIASASASPTSAIAVAGVVTTPSSTSIPLSTSTSSLTGNWKVTAINGYPIQFDVSIDGKQIGFKYCNTKGFGYTSTGNSISVTPGFSTRMACTDMYPTESSVDNCFTSASTFSLSGNTLRLLNKSSQTTVTLVRA